MEQVSYNLRLDLKDTGIVNTGFRLKQGDSGMKISVSIFNRGVNVFDSTTVPKIVFKRPDGASVMANMTVGSSVYEYVFVGNELQQPGVEIMDVKFTLPNDRRESSVSCSFVVVPDTITPNTHGSDIYDNDLAELVAEATAAAETVEEVVGDSEAWAVGERNGVPVGPEDPAYHNNSKYWSEQANVTSLAALTDVELDNPADGDGLVYNSTSQKWKNIPVISRILTLFDGWKKSGSYNLCSNERMYTQIIGGTLTVTFNPTGYPKGCIRLQGYVSSGQWITINSRTMKLITGQTYRLLGSVGGSTSTYRLRYYDSVNQIAEYDGEEDFVCGDSDTAELSIYVNSTGASASNPIDTVLYPMITADLTATVADYVPFIDDDEYGSGIADYITPITSGNNIETNNCTVDAIGKLRVFHLSIKFSANATGTITIATAKAGSKPISLISFVEVSGTTAKSAYIDIDGNIKLDNPIAGWHSGTLAYLAKD